MCFQWQQSDCRDPRMKQKFTFIYFRPLLLTDGGSKHETGSVNNLVNICSLKFLFNIESNPANERKQWFLLTVLDTGIIVRNECKFLLLTRQSSSKIYNHAIFQLCNTTYNQSPQCCHHLISQNKQTIMLQVQVNQ